MKILLIGGTGLVGSYLLPKLTSRGYKVFALTNDEKETHKIEKTGACSVLGDIRDLHSFKNAFPDKPDVIVLIEMPSVKPGIRMNKSRKDDLRAETNYFFRNSMNLAIRFNIPVILPGGTSYATSGDEIADESWPILRKGLSEIGADIDAMINESLRTSYPQVVQLIFGKIYGNGGLFRYKYEIMGKGKGNIIGKGDNYIPIIHADDAASAIVKTIEKLPVGEKFIIADDTPVTQMDFLFQMAKLMNIKQPGHIPDTIIKLALGKDLYEILTSNCRVTNAKAKKVLDWNPFYISYKEGLDAAIKEIKEEKKPELKS